MVHRALSEDSFMHVSELSDGGEGVDLWDAEGELRGEFDAELRRSDEVHARTCNDLLEEVKAHAAKSAALEAENSRLRSAVHAAAPPAQWTREQAVPYNPAAQALLKSASFLRARARPAATVSLKRDVAARRREPAAEEAAAEVAALRAEVAALKETLAQRDRDATVGGCVTKTLPSPKGGSHATPTTVGPASNAPGGGDAATASPPRAPRTLSPLVERSEQAESATLREAFARLKSMYAAQGAELKRLKDRATGMAAPDPAHHASLLHRLKVATQDFSELERSHEFLAQQVELGKGRYMELRRTHDAALAQLADARAAGTQLSRLSMATISALYKHATPAARGKADADIHHIDELLAALVRAVAAEDGASKRLI
eukprot:TRINITY_DN30648_c0_g1_i1.p1 TRINITY_DN30648_c0_g1~~TRINITY_DN30648_c0_g1_i1.p1  ORF type:complete len:375 (+),score=139.81 TRINITY_DN30648_c0_g1_i1:106-1230(+)